MKLPGIPFLLSTICCVCGNRCFLEERFCYVPWADIGYTVLSLLPWLNEVYIGVRKCQDEEWYRKAEN